MTIGSVIQSNALEIQVRKGLERCFPASPLVREQTLKRFCERMDPKILDLLLIDASVFKDEHELVTLSHLVRKTLCPVFLLCSSYLTDSQELFDAIEICEGHPLSVDRFFLPSQKIPTFHYELQVLVQGLNKKRHFSLQRFSERLNPKSLTFLSQKMERSPGLITIVSEYGGLAVLQNIIPCLPKNFPVPVIVATSLSSEYIRDFAMRIDILSGLTVTLPRDGQSPQEGHVYITGGDRVLTLGRDADGDGVMYVQDIVEPYRLLNHNAFSSVYSAATTYGASMTAVVLNGISLGLTEALRVTLEQGGDVLICEATDSLFPYTIPPSLETSLHCHRVSLQNMAEQILKIY